jgi:hypothetical protein
MNRNEIIEIAKPILLEDIQANGWWYASLEIVEDSNIVIMKDFYRNTYMGDMTTESIYFPFNKNGVLFKIKRYDRYDV